MESSIENCRQLSDKRSVGETRDVIKSFEGCRQEGLGNLQPSQTHGLILDWPNSSFIRVQLQSKKGRQKLETRYQKTPGMAPGSGLEKQTGLEGVV